MALEQLLQQHPDIWRGPGLCAPAPPGVPSGFSELDAELPGGGWPEGALSEILGGGANFDDLLVVISRCRPWRG